LETLGGTEVCWSYQCTPHVDSRVYLPEISVYRDGYAAVVLSYSISDFSFYQRYLPLLGKHCPK